MDDATIPTILQIATFFLWCKLKSYSDFSLIHITMHLHDTAIYCLMKFEFCLSIVCISTSLFRNIYLKYVICLANLINTSIYIYISIYSYIYFIENVNKDIIINIM